MPQIESTEHLRRIIGEPRSVTPSKITETLQPEAVEFIRRSPFLFLATANAEGRPDVSPKGDEPGFVVVEDAGHLVIPERPGNRLIMGLQNILANPCVSLIFLVPGTEETLRVGGTAKLLETSDVPHRLDARGKSALLAIRVSVDRCFFHCARAFKRGRLWDAATWPAVEHFSFGRIMARSLGRGDDLAQQIDAAVETGYREDL
jgi:PPOX class probable FMN-dependent enzyme